MDIGFDVAERKNNKVVAVVVTYNRKKLVQECINAILNQTYRIEKLILINNCSTDGTETELQSKGYLDNNQICYIKTDSNIGGSGGFFEGIIRAKQYQYDWLWLMDDDTIPTSNCLEELIKANNLIEKSLPIQGLEHAYRPSFFASTVYGPGKEFMNVPTVNSKKAPNGYSYWYNFLDRGLVNIEMATFVSILIKKEAIEKCGLPCKDFFIWGDDSEYTKRLTKYYGDAYLVGRSIAVHKRSTLAPVRMATETDLQRIKMFRYKYRNLVIINRYYEPDYHLLIHMLGSIKESFQYVGEKYGGEKMKAILKGHWEGIMQYKKFKHYIDGQIKEKAENIKLI